jgi:putative ABC transport system permease protein
LAYAARTLARRPGFTLAAGLSLALGIGATTAVFTVLNAVALHPLAYPEGDRLVWMTQILKGSTTDDVTLTTAFLEWRRQNESFTDLAAYNYVSRNLSSGAQPIEAQTARASASLLPILGVQPALGRNFLKFEDYKGRDAVALVSDGLWRRQFAADPHIIGRPITLDGRDYTVIGVLPRDFVFPGPDPVEVITPLAKDEAAELDPQHPAGTIVRNVVGRLRPGVPLARAGAEIDAIQSRLPLPPFRPIITIQMMPLRDHLYGDAARAGLVLVLAAGFLLLIACANVSHLLLVRLMERDRELAIRTVLGGSRGRLLRQLLTENGLLGALALGTGILIAWAARFPLLAWSPYRAAGLRSLPFDGRVLAFAVTAGALTTLLFGLAPAFRATEIRLAEAIKVGAGSVVGGRGALRVLSLIAAGEIATLSILATGAGLMFESFWKIRYAGLGFQPDKLMAARLTLSGQRYQTQAQQSAFIQQLLERAEAIPGVEAATVTQAGELPPGSWHATNLFSIVGRPPAPQGQRPFARYPRVTPGYFRILGIPLLRGRLPADSDTANTPPVVVVNRELVRRYFPGQEPLGQEVQMGPPPTRYRIVGVVGDVKGSGLAARPEPAIYLPYRQAPGMTELGVILQCALDPAMVARELRLVVAAIDPNQPVATVQTMNQRLSESVARPRFTTVMLGAFAGLAALLGILGVYGVMSCRATWQARELAVRQALGAQRRDVIGHVLRQGVRMIAPGVAAGILGSLALGRVLASLLYDVRPDDPWTLAAVSGAVAAVALAACWLPALRASRGNLLGALRQE